MTATIVLPSFLLILLGYFLKIRGVMDDVAGEKMNQISFRVFIPTMVFYNIFSSNIDILSHVDMAIFTVVSIIILFVVVTGLVCLTVKERNRKGVMIQGICRSNFVLLGIGLVSNLYGEVSAGVAAVVAAICVPMFNTFSTIALAYFGGKDINAKKIAVGVCKNPLIISTLLGFFCYSININFGPILENVIAQVSRIATPLALIILGASFSFSQIGDRGKLIAVATVGKLIVVPAVGVVAAVLLGFREEALMTLLVLFAAPTAISSHVMACNAGGDGELAGQIVVFATGGSVVTMFIMVYTLLSMGYL